MMAMSQVVPFHDSNSMILTFTSPHRLLCPLESDARAVVRLSLAPEILHIASDL